MRVLSRVLVTGGAGFVGSGFVHRLLARRAEVRVVTLDLLTYAGDRANLDELPDPTRHTFVEGDVCDTARVRALIAEHRIDTVVHFAAESHVDRSIDGPAVFLRTNVLGTASVLEAARDAWADQPPRRSLRVHHVSTDEVYGDLDGDAAPAREDDPYRPSSPYAASKAAADHLLTAWARTYGLPVSATHASNTYGPRQVPEKFVPVVIGRALAGEPVPIYGDGRQVRDWLHVDDHADGVIAAVERGVDGGRYNLAGGISLENRALAERICAVLDELRPAGAPHARHLTRVSDRPGHDRRYAVDDSRARASLGWAPRVAFPEGLAATVRWYVARG